MTPAKNLDIQPRGALCGRDVSYRAMPVLVVIPGHEGFDPRPRSLQRFKSAGVAWAKLDGSEESFGEGIVIAHAGTAERRDHSEVLQGLQHRSAFHRVAVVGVQHDSSGIDPVGRT